MPRRPPNRNLIDPVLALQMRAAIPELRLADEQEAHKQAKDAKKAAEKQLKNELELLAGVHRAQNAVAEPQDEPEEESKDVEAESSPEAPISNAEPQSTPQETAEPDVRPVREYNIKVLDWSQHGAQRLLIESKKKRKMVKAGRRGGKTSAAVALAILYFTRGKRVRYAAPVTDQTDRFWMLVKNAMAEPIEHGLYYKNETRRIIEPNGSERQQIRAVTAWNVDQLRGDACDLLILEEYQLQDENAWEQVGQPMLVDYNGDALLIFTPPSLTSRSTSKAKDKLHAIKMYREKLKDPNWLCLHFSSQDNPYLSAEGLEEVARGMNRLAYRQEILAEDIEEVPGALWTCELIEQTRIKIDEKTRLNMQYLDPAFYRRIVIGVDPSGSNTSTTETGIIAAGEGFDNHIYFFRDRSRVGTPKEWAGAAISLYQETLADRIIGEQNFGGQMVESTIRNIDPNVSYRNVVASRSKIVRAQPIVALFEQGRAHIVGDMPELEEQMVSYVAGDKSPDRLDAMVWSGTELVGFGALGLVEFLKSEKASEMGRVPMPMTAMNRRRDNSIEKVSSAENLAAVATNDKTPKCPQCQSICISMVAGQHRCGNCGKQWWPGAPPVDVQRPLGGRQISLAK